MIKNLRFTTSTLKPTPSNSSQKMNMTGSNHILSTRSHLLLRMTSLRLTSRATTGQTAWARWIWFPFMTPSSRHSPWCQRRQILSSVRYRTSTMGQKLREILTCAFWTTPSSTRSSALLTHTPRIWLTLLVWRMWHSNLNTWVMLSWTTWSLLLDSLTRAS